MSGDPAAPQTDPDFLAQEEYDQPAELNTRIQIQQRFGADGYGWFHWVFDQIETPAEARILDLGGGSAAFWLENGHRLPPAWRVLFCDLSPGMAQAARQSLAQAGSFTFVVADAQAPPLAAGQFDAVLALGLFDHLPHRRQAFAGCHRLLRPGGRLYASAGSQRHLQELEALVTAFVGDASYGGDAERFGLENGAALLQPWFSDVCLSRYEDRIVLRQRKPVLAYVLSEAAMSQRLCGRRLRAFARHVQRELNERGEIALTVERGLFTATRAEQG
jgi:SAM-dependent methyltransferase